MIHRRNTESPTLIFAFDEFMSEKENKNLAADTLNNYRRTWKMFSRFHGFPVQMRADEVTSVHVTGWIRSMRQEGLKTASLNHYIADIRAFLYWCMDDERGYIQPFWIRNVTGQEEQIKLFTDEELFALLEKPRKRARFSEWRGWAIVNWVLATGSRASTICAVRVGDIDFAAKEIRLAHTKNKRSQIIPLSPALEQAMREYIRQWRAWEADTWLFPNVCGDQLTRKALVKCFSVYCKSRGVKRTSVHGLRHNFAKGWVSNHGSVFTLQKVLGHSTLEMTRRYVRLFDADVKADYNLYAPLDTMKRPGSRKQKVGHKR